MFAPDDHNKLTCRKSTSGMKRAHIPFGLQNRRTSDSQILIPDQKSKTSQTLGLKLVFKRQSGDKYEISSPLSISGTAEAQKKVKFTFDEENENNTDQQEQAKVEDEKIPFEPSDLVEKDDELVAHILKNQPRVKITHSIPFPIALVEDKTNIVHTKALLLIHLYKSFSSPCIICVLCKCFFSINDFSKHFHLSEEDLFDEDDEEDEETHENITDDSKPIDAQKKPHVTLNLEQRREKKLAELRKKSFKILPYCLNKNNELNEDQLKIWKIFGERYTTFKRTHQQSITLKPKTNSIETKSSLKKKSIVDSLNKEKDKENKTDISNWDYIDVEKKTSYFITRERLECERIIFLNNPSITQSIQNTTNKKDDSLENEADLHLSEEESDSEKEKETEKKISTVIEKQPEYIEDNSYLFLNMPTRIEKCFNYYDNLSHHIRCFIESSPHIITPQSLISFNITNRLKNYKFLLLSQDRSFKLKWLCSSLDLHQSKG